MTLGKDASIVADSTMSSSPARVPDASPQIKRATRTYGKRREEPVTEGTTDSTWYPTSSSENIHKTAPPGLKETVPASSPEKMVMDYPIIFDAILGHDKAGRRHDVGDIERGSHSLESGLQGAWAKCGRWKQDMVKIDKIFDDDIPESEQENSSPKYSLGKKLFKIDQAFEDIPESTSTSLEATFSFGKALLLHDANCNIVHPGCTRTESLTPPLTISDDVFNGPPSTLSRPDVPQSPFSLSSPIVRPNRSRHRIVRDSDSEAECQKGSSSTAPSTSNHSFFKSRSWSTPPTSDEDMPSKISVNSKPSQHHKSNLSQVSSPVDSLELPSKDGNRVRKPKRTKIKAYTKKEFRETTKERVRLAAQRKVTVPRAEASSKYTVENLLKIVSGQQSQNQVSDPIEPFTSPITKESPCKELVLSIPVSPSSPNGAETLDLENPDDSEDELPEITELLHEDATKRHAEELKKMKKWALEQQTAAASQGNEDDDLVISTDPKTTIKEEEENRRSRPSKSVARKTVAQLAHINPAQAKKALVVSPTRLRHDFPSVMQDVSGSSADLQRIMLVQAQEHASRERRRKLDEWTKYGGRLAQKPVAPAENFECAVKAIAGKGLDIVKAGKYDQMEAESDNDGDQEWGPETNDLRSTELTTDDEYDKENNTKLMYDQGEDKENQRVVRHAPISKKYTIFDVTDAALLSPESSTPNFSPDVNSIARRPFQELLSESSATATLLAASSSTQTFVSKLQQASPLVSSLAPAPSLKPFLREGSGFEGFSQFSQVEPDAFGAPLQPGFSELFESADALDLTQDVAAAIQLQPAFQAEESLVRKADAIFEKEQAFVIEANSKKVTRQPTELYVNELGFLTQTMPLDGTPEVYHRVSPAHSAMKSQIETPSQRMPLQTLSLSSPSQFESPRQEPLRRLRRVSTSSRTRVRSPTASPLVWPMRHLDALDALEELRRGQLAQHRREETKRKRLALGNLLEDEAAESDDDNMFGFMTKKPADDEEDGEDMDQDLPGLVDDQRMDADTEAADLVLDKYKEHLEEDDKKLEELHQAAVQGQLRQKRTRGIGIDDSEDESDADDNERARRAMKRARKSDRTDIKGLEANKETRAFADTYNQCLRDDDDDFFSFLEKRHDIDDILASHTDGGDEVDSDENGEIPAESVDVLQIHKTIQERAKEGSLEENQIDLDDVSWLDQDEDMEDVPRVKNVNTRQGRTSRPEISDLETIIPFRKGPTTMNQTSKQWFTEESKTRNASTARKNGGLAVTGHRKREIVVRKGQTSIAHSSAPVRPVKAAASALSIMADKSRNFA